MKEDMQFTVASVIGNLREFLQSGLHGHHVPHEQVTAMIDYVKGDELLLAAKEVETIMKNIDTARRFEALQGKFPPLAKKNKRISLLWEKYKVTGRATLSQDETLKDLLFELTTYDNAAKAVTEAIVWEDALESLQSELRPFRDRFDWTRFWTCDYAIAKTDHVTALKKEKQNLLNKATLAKQIYRDILAKNKALKRSMARNT